MIEGTLVCFWAIGSGSGPNGSDAPTWRPPFEQDWHYLKDSTSLRIGAVLPAGNLVASALTNELDRDPAREGTRLALVESTNHAQTGPRPPPQPPSRNLVHCAK